MTFAGRDITKIVAEEVESLSWHLRETIRVRELAAKHRLGQMRRLLMLEENKICKRKFGFDRIDTAAEMEEKRSRTSLILGPFFYSNMLNPRRPHAPDEFTPEMKGYVQGVKMEMVISQPAPPQCNPLPRRSAVDMGSEKPGTSRRSPAVGTGSDGPGVSRVET